MYLHNHENFKDLIELTAKEQGINDPYLVEKDYWIMHCLYGLSNFGLDMELKGGTSLSKAFNVIGDSPKKLGNLQSDTNRVTRHKRISDEEKVYRGTDHSNPT